MVNYINPAEESIDYLLRVVK